jgi:diguanylate cyclase (GGDEF)-like protein
MEGPPSANRPALLVIDDDPATVRLASRSTLNLLSSHSLGDGLEKVRTMRLSAALIDVGVCRDNLTEVVKVVRAAASNFELPVIFCSSDGRLATRMAAAEAGAIRFLDKPLSEQKLAELLRQVPMGQPQSARIVIVDDDPIVLEKYESELRESDYFVRGVVDPAELIDALEDVRPDVLLLDVNLGKISGIDICKALRCSEQWQFLPILVFSGDKDAEMRFRAYQAGASDVLGKPLSVEELMARVHVQAERIKLMRDRSNRDPLSGLMLRRAFSESLQRDVASCSRENKRLSFALLDLDHFKEINDPHGHLVGDRVIASFGAFLRRRLRLEDLCGRWGGEEFVLAFSGQDGQFAQAATERLLAEFAQEVFVTDEGERFSVTFTAGIAVYPDDSETLEGLIEKADELLYEGKSAGRARVCRAPDSSEP